MGLIAENSTAGHNGPPTEAVTVTKLEPDPISECYGHGCAWRRKIRHQPSCRFSQQAPLGMKA
jgi:hypothetical protein